MTGDSGGGFPSLKQLDLNGMLNLVQWKDSEEVGDYFPCLEKLKIWQLRQMPNFLPPNLTYLEIDGCASLVSLPRLSSSLIGRHLSRTSLMVNGFIEPPVGITKNSWGQGKANTLRHLTGRPKARPLDKAVARRGGTNHCRKPYPKK
ncbi:hypothetical protein ACLOJK_015569 [Asimina triloba]